MSSDHSLIRSDIDLDAPGKQCGFLRLPHSVNRSAYGFIPIPIVSVRHGDGPCVLLVSGNHGDEYEGQVALMDLIRRVRPEDITGQLIILSAANFPAVMAAARVSPIDGGNLNREFPGQAMGTPTQMIAHYISTALAPRADYCFDIHSGGTSLNYLPTLLTGPVREEPLRSRVLALIEAIGLPYTVVFRGGGVTGGRNLATVVRSHGGVPLAAEMGGGAGLSPESVAIAKGALARYLRATGVWIAGDGPEAPGVETRIVAVTPDDYAYATEAGVFEPARVIGDTVAAGDLAGMIHFPDTPWRDPVEILFQRPGTILCHRPISQCARGDCLFQTGQPWPEAFS